MDLEAYLQGDFVGQMDGIRRLQARATSLMDVYCRFFGQGTGSWPYQLRNGKGLDPQGSFSFSTSAMILHSIASAVGVLHGSLISPPGRYDEPMVSEAGVERLDAGIKSLIEHSVSLWAAPPQLPPELAYLTPFLVSDSRTFGVNDPLTITWMFELLQYASEKPALAAQVPLAEFGWRVAAAAAEVRDRAFRTPRTPLLRFWGAGSDPVEHSFPLLRAVQLDRILEACGCESSIPNDELLEHAVDKVHTEISKSTIANSSFDAAELVFAMESVLLLDPRAIERTVIDRVFSVLGTAQAGSPFWRPTRPLTVNPQGAVLLPQSVEMANSLLRVCRLLDEDRGSPDNPSRFSEQLQLFRNYEEWLDSRYVFGTTDAGQEFEGWQSDHTHAQRRVHLWHTSQVLLFLVHYGRQLREHVALTARTSAGFATRYFVPTLKELDEVGAKTLQEFPMKSWLMSLGYEPMAGTAAQSPYRVYARVDERYVRPRWEDRPYDAKWSMLLYGPPGTGKSVFAEALAKALGWGMITLTPSDFIERGEAGVEARAKAIFVALRAQKDFVVLFDEIDRLLLDRDSEQYGQQSDMFQFMTPGMLTKLNDLRKAKRVIFIIATNYAERIDEAIKRAGRIDEQFLLLPPDAKRRHAFLRERAGLDDQVNIDDVVKKTSLFSHTELKDLVADVRANHPNIEGQALVDALVVAADHYLPSLSLGAYEPRFDRKEGKPVTREKFPVTELLLLAHLKKERDPAMTADTSAVKDSLHFRSAIAGDDPAVTATLNALQQTL